jgi:hypothetical protein
MKKYCIQCQESIQADLEIDRSSVNYISPMIRSLSHSQIQLEQFGLNELCPWAFANLFEVHMYHFRFRCLWCNFLGFELIENLLFSTDRHSNFILLSLSRSRSLSRFLALTMHWSIVPQKHEFEQRRRAEFPAHIQKKSVIWSHQCTVSFHRFAVGSR